MDPPQADYHLCSCQSTLSLAVEKEENKKLCFFKTTYPTPQQNFGANRCQKRTGTEGRIQKAEKIENWKAKKLTGRPNK